MRKDPRTKITMSKAGEFRTKKTKTKINYSMLSYLDERPQSPRWTDKEIEKLRGLKARCLPTELVSHIMRRSYASIRNMMYSKKYKSGIKSTYLPRWTKKEIKTLIEGKTAGMTEKEISIKIGRTVIAVRNKWAKCQLV